MQPDSSGGIPFVDIGNRYLIHGAQCDPQVLQHHAWAQVTAALHDPASAQSFTCRGAARTSAAGMVMAFNPDDPHDGAASDELGFTYRMVHIGPQLVAGVLADIAGRAAGLPLFADPVVSDPVLARNLLALHRALLGGAATLRRDELLAAAIHTLVRRAATGGTGWPQRTGPASRAATTAVAGRAKELISGSYLADLSLGDLAAAAGVSRFSIHRAFQAAYSMAPSGS